jgi:hypothetical protein
MLGNCLTPVQNMYYRRAMKKSPDGRAPPEARLVMGCVGAILIPIGMFWFAWYVDRCLGSRDQAYISRVPGRPSRQFIIWSR